MTRAVCLVSREQYEAMLRPAWRHERASYLERLTCAAQQKKYAEGAQQGRALPPCNWCGEPTDDWCEHCHLAAPDVPAHALCSLCDATFRMCRLCRLELQRKKGVRPTARACPGSSWMGTSRCLSCHKQGRFKVCSGCMCARYCSVVCQKLDWRVHKPLCAFLQNKQPLTIVYPWHYERARAAADHPSLLPRVCG